MLWENLREEEFKKAVEISNGLCILPIGCLEKHGQHLPVGTDSLHGIGIAERAADDCTADSAEARVMMLDALDTLSDAERQVITLHAVSGLKLDAIARVMNEPLGTIKWRHSQAMKKIRGAMSAGEEAVK